MEAVASRDKKKTVNTETMDRKNEEEVKQKKGKRSITHGNILHHLNHFCKKIGT
jgi:hypothetical protein